MLLRRLLSLLIAAPLLFATAASAQSKQVLLVAIGGNSECSDDTGIIGLFRDKASPGQRTKPGSGKLQRTFKSLLDGTGHGYSERYFSWTGDPIGQPGCLPGHANWIRGGSAYIQAQWPELNRAGADQKIIIIGWSNGGATAYELACDLSRRPGGGVSLLVTLDPVSWTTRACAGGDDAGAPVAPARLWASVFTESAADQKTAASNIIAFFGNAWNANFPSGPAVRPQPLYRASPMNHGHVFPMWRDCIVTGGVLAHWKARTFGGDSVAVRSGRACGLVR